MNWKEGWANGSSTQVHSGSRLNMADLMKKVDRVKRAKLINRQTSWTKGSARVYRMVFSVNLFEHAMIMYAPCVMKKI